MASRFFHDIILHDKFSVNETPFTTTELLDNAEVDQTMFWNEMKESQLTSIYATLGNIPNLPDQNYIPYSSK